jgi:hypothetical protein
LSTPNLILPFFHFVEFPVISFILRSDPFMWMLAFTLIELENYTSRELLMRKFHFQIIMRFRHNCWKPIKRSDLMTRAAGELACGFLEWGNTICWGLRNS